MQSKSPSQYRNSVRFVLDGEIVELQDVDPNRTVLQYLREDLCRSGSKEGCAEGDCGACTVVVVDTDASSQRLRACAVNACIQFLPTLDGKELLTVESLSSTDGELHPAQRAMVDCHGSQCGFCTPGFVMSMFALYKQNPAPTRRQIDEALAGNLCRCTGYSPIVDAAGAMYEFATDADDWLVRPAGTNVGSDERRRLTMLESIASDVALCVETAGRKFFAPQNEEQLAGLVAALPHATILAGGTDVGLWVTKQLKNLDTVIYTGNVAGLDDVTIGDEYIDIGAAASITKAMSPIIEQFPDLEELFVRFASPPIRNAATLGGNIANGSPIGDSMPALMVLDTELILRAGDTTRSVKLADFYLGYQQTALRPGEFLQRIRIPLPGSNVQVRSYKVSKRFDQDISAVCTAYFLRLEKGRVSEIRVACGGMAAVPARASRCEAALQGAVWDESVIEQAMRALDEDFTPIGDMRSSAEYRRQVCRNLLKRFYLESDQLTATRVYTYGR